MKPFDRPNAQWTPQHAQTYLAWLAARCTLQPGTTAARDLLADITSWQAETRVSPDAYITRGRLWTMLAAHCERSFKHGSQYAGIALRYPQEADPRTAAPRLASISITARLTHEQLTEYMRRGGLQWLRDSLG